MAKSVRKSVGKLIECPSGKKVMAMANSREDLLFKGTQWYCECVYPEKNKRRICMVELESEVQEELKELVSQ